MAPRGWVGPQQGKLFLPIFIKEISLKNHRTRKVLIYIEASRHTVD
jgi:hypothetical protein